MKLSVSNLSRLNSKNLLSQEKVLIDSSSNPLLGPAIVNKDVNPTCSYLITLLLDDQEITLSVRIKKILATVELCCKRKG